MKFSSFEAYESRQIGAKRKHQSVLDRTNSAPGSRHLNTPNGSEIRRMLLAHAPTHPTPELGGSPNPKQRSKISSARAGDDHEKEAAARELPRPQASVSLRSSSGSGSRSISKRKMSSAFSGDETAPFFGFLGAAAALIFSCAFPVPIPPLSHSRDQAVPYRKLRFFLRKA